MLQKCKYIVSCDNDCGSQPTPFNSRKDILQSRYIIYRYYSINETSDKLFEDMCNGFVQRELHFCCQSCVEDYFNYYPERRSHYKKINNKSSI